MSTPIITLIKTRLEITLNTITDIKKVYMFPVTPINADTAPYPFTAVFDTHDGWENRNQLEVNILNFHLETWVKVGADTDTLVTRLDLLEAKIHDAIMAELKTGLLHNYIQKSEKRSPSKQYVDEDSTGILTQGYILTYLQKYGNSFL